MRAPFLFCRGESEEDPADRAVLFVPYLTGTGVHAILAKPHEGAAMQTVRIYRLKDLDRRTRARLKAAQLEAARVWMYCLQRHQTARTERTHWPDRDDLQRETKGGQYALHSQSIQMVCQQFLANAETIKQLRLTNPLHRYPHHPKKYRTVQWPAQAVCHQGKRLILPMGRGRKPFSFHLPDLPEQIRAVSLVWRGGYELHLVVPTFPEAEVPAPASPAVQAAVDLGEIHLAAVTTSTGKGLIVTGRGIRSLKRHYNMTLGRLSRLQARCQRGSKRGPRLQYTRARASGKRERRVRDPLAQRHAAGGGLLPSRGGADALRGRPARGAQRE
jgi:putative transposase